VTARAPGAWACHDGLVVDIEDLLPRSRTPRDYLNLVNDPRIDQEGLRVLAGSPYSFVRTAVAGHLQTDAATLAELVVSDLDRWDRNYLLKAVAGHPHADRAVLLRVLQETAALLNQPNARPYAAALRLARRSELHAEEVRVLTRQPGASRRMRRGVRRRLAARTPAMGT
jgi:hypothetical protein